MNKTDGRTISLDWVSTLVREKIRLHYQMNIESDCMGDYMTFMDSIGYFYPPGADNDTIRMCFRHAYVDYMRNVFLGEIGQYVTFLAFGSNQPG